MVEKGDLIFDGFQLYTFEKLEDGKVHCFTVSDNTIRVHNAAGNPFWVVPTDKKEVVLEALKRVEAAKNILNILLENLPKI